ncbi:hypothetical protein DERF_008507 [Dermatophagoides farinae]|uniref:Uncharacterized protein n=1 Tax=Dermatophagoides farinae TaxID=6954 RepID=A0A922L718_DERFA|nr:hypothetical protein DERF_008507 [Dermatophagoides farinae]
MAKIIIIITLLLFSDKLAKNIHQKHPEIIDLNEVKTFFIIVSILMGSIWICFTAIGLFGALFEHYCLTLTYCMLNLISLIYHLIKSFNDPLYWCVVVVDFIIMIISIIFD